MSELQLGLMDYFVGLNNERLHQSLSYLTPDEIYRLQVEVELGLQANSARSTPALRNIKIRTHGRTVSLGGFKFQVQRVNDGAIAPRLPGAWQSPNIFVGVCSGDGRGRSVRAGCSPTSPCLWAGIGAASHSCSRWSRVATGCRDQQRIPGSPAARPGVRARPSLSTDHTSTFYAAARAYAGVSS